MAKKILLIEDFPVIQDLYGKYLKEHGFAVDIANNGKQALAMVEGTDYDFILVDLLLPDVNGIEFLENFTKKSENTKVFVLSDFSEPDAIQQAKELGVEKYLLKAENTPSQLLEKLQDYEENSDTE